MGTCGWRIRVFNTETQRELRRLRGCGVLVTLFVVVKVKLR
jgi:hypothetical protein